MFPPSFCLERTRPDWESKEMVLLRLIFLFYLLVFPITVSYANAGLFFSIPSQVSVTSGFPEKVQWSVSGTVQDSYRLSLVSGYESWMLVKGGQNNASGYLLLRPKKSVVGDFPISLQACSNKYPEICGIANVFISVAQIQQSVDDPLLQTPPEQSEEPHQIPLSATHVGGRDVKLSLENAENLDDPQLILKDASGNVSEPVLITGSYLVVSFDSDFSGQFEAAAIEAGDVGIDGIPIALPNKVKFVVPQIIDLSAYSSESYDSPYFGSSSIRACKLILRNSKVPSLPEQHLNLCGQESFDPFFIEGVVKGLAIGLDMLSETLFFDETIESTTKGSYLFTETVYSATLDILNDGMSLASLARYGGGNENLDLDEKAFAKVAYELSEDLIDYSKTSFDNEDIQEYAFGFVLGALIEQAVEHKFKSNSKASTDFGFSEYVRVFIEGGRPAIEDSVLKIRYKKRLPESVQADSVGLPYIVGTINKVGVLKDKYEEAVYASIDEYELTEKELRYFLSLAADIVPVVGTIKSGYQGIFGIDPIIEEELEIGERAVEVVGLFPLTKLISKAKEAKILAKRVDGFLALVRTNYKIGKKAEKLVKEKLLSKYPDIDGPRHYGAASGSRFFDLKSVQYKLAVESKVGNVGCT